MNSDSLASKGVLYAKIELPSSETRFLHCFTTHLQASYDSNTSNHRNEEVRIKQLQQFHSFISETLSLGSLDFTNEKVILLGDFNIDSMSKDSSHSQEYQEMIRILFSNSSISNDFIHHDIMFEKYNAHPITVGDKSEDEKGNLQPRDLVLTYDPHNSVPKSIDYIFLLDPIVPGKQQDSTLSSSVLYEHSYVENFFVLDKPFTQLSDHYGLVITVSL